MSENTTPKEKGFLVEMVETPRFTNPFNQNSLVDNHFNLFNHSTYSTISTNDLILFIFYKKLLTIKELHLEFIKIRDISLTSVYNAIKRDGDRKSGLSYDGLVEVKEIKQDVDYWGLTQKGVEYVNDLIKQEQDKQNKAQKIERESLETANQIHKFEIFLKQYYNTEILEIFRLNKKTLIINYGSLCEFYPEIDDVFFEDFDNVCKAFEIALSRFDDKNLKINIRFTNIPESQKVSLGSIRSEHINKAIIIEGIIKQSGMVKPRCSIAKFECPACGNIITISQLENKFREPTNCGCGRKGKFKLLNKELRDFQRIRIEETGEHLKGRSQPSDIVINLYDDLTNPNIQAGYNPGKIIRVFGVLNEVQKEIKGGVKSIDFDLMITANNITFLEAIIDTNISETDIKKIQEFSNQPDLLKQLSDRIAPTVCGHEVIKQGLLCSLVKGYNTKRKDIHILIIGDPGLGKSELAENCLDILPGSKWVSGANSSGSGLSSTVTKDELLGGWSVQAGALPLANNSVAILDELDKVDKKDLSVLSDALEKQEIIVNKASVHTSLKCETTIIATANPKGGRFDDTIDFFKQIDLPLHLFNRFDLIFVLIDYANKEFDNQLAEFILERQDLVKDSERDFLRKYMLYARKINPEMSTTAKTYLKDLYSQLRPKDSTKNINPRQLNTLIRLSSCFAKLRLSATVEIQDVNLAKNLFFDTFKRLLGEELDFDKVNVGISQKDRDTKKTILQLIPLEGITTYDLLNLIKLNKSDLASYINDLTDEGEVFVNNNYVKKIEKVISK